MAKLYFHYSTMNAGKSTALLQASYNYVERGMTTMLFIAALDDRAGRGRIGSRIGLSAEADIFGPEDDLFEIVRERVEQEPIHCIFVDEAQFLSEEQVWQFARVADRLGVPVMCYGLRTDFRGKLFPGSHALLAIADELREVRTICRCGRRATMVVRLGPDGKVLRQGAQVAIGDAQYVSLCRRHWEEEMGRWPAEDFVGFAGE
jgi:thymidine kinase